MIAALGLCVPVVLMTAAVFTRPGLVVEVGWGQVGAFVLVCIGTLGTIFPLQGRFHGRPGVDRVLRVVLGLFALAVLLHPSDAMASGMAVFVVLGLAAGLVRAWRSRRRAPLAGEGEGAGA